MKSQAPAYEENRTQFVFTDPCGCPFGLVEGSYAKTEDGAWDIIADSRAEERAMRNRGVRVEHVSHDEYVERFYPRMTQRCTHGGA